MISYIVEANLLGVQKKSIQKTFIDLLNSSSIDTADGVVAEDYEEGHTGCRHRDEGSVSSHAHPSLVVDPAYFRNRIASQLHLAHAL